MRLRAAEFSFCSGTRENVTRVAYRPRAKSRIPSRGLVAKFSLQQDGTMLEFIPI